MASDVREFPNLDKSLLASCNLESQRKSIWSHSVGTGSMLTLGWSLTAQEFGAHQVRVVRLSWRVRHSSFHPHSASGGEWSVNSSTFKSALCKAIMSVWLWVLCKHCSMSSLICGPGLSSSSFYMRDGGHRHSVCVV